MKQSKKAWLELDICYQTGKSLRTLIHLIHHGRVTKGHRLKSFSLQFKEGSVLIVLKKESPKGDQVAFIEAEGSMTAALWCMERAVKSKRVPWKQDKWMKRGLDKKWKGR